MKDRMVEIRGDQLLGQRADLIVAGGIAAIEAPRLARELRRYGADVRAVMTPAASKFITPLSLEWATEHHVISDLSGGAEHISDADFLIVLPATLDFIAKASMGFADNAALTFLQSALGRKPIIFVPTMHDSLAQNPTHQEHIKRLSKMSGVFFVEPRREEGKAKSPAVDEMAEHICHLVCRAKAKSQKVLVTLGPTQSPIDDVRFVSNFSSGALGTAIAHAFYRKGADVRAIAGPARVLPSKLISTVSVHTNLQMRAALKTQVSQFKPDVVVFCAAVLDFDVAKARHGKSTSKSKLEVTLSPSSKLIETYKTSRFLKVGFKLESRVSDKELLERAWTAVKDQRADFLVANRLEDVRATQHRAFVLNVKTKETVECLSKQAIAQTLAQQIG